MPLGIHLILSCFYVLAWETLSHLNPDIQQYQDPSARTLQYIMLKEMTLNNKQSFPVLSAQATFPVSESLLGLFFWTIPVCHPLPWQGDTRAGDTALPVLTLEPQLRQKPLHPGPSHPRTAVVLTAAALNQGHRQSYCSTLHPQI